MILFWLGEKMFEPLPSEALVEGDVEKLEVRAVPANELEMVVGDLRQGVAAVVGTHDERLELWHVLQSLGQKLLELVENIVGHGAKFGQLTEVKGGNLWLNQHSCRANQVPLDTFLAGYSYLARL